MEYPKIPASSHGLSSTGPNLRSPLRKPRQGGRGNGKSGGHGIGGHGKKAETCFFWVVQKMNMLALGRNLFKWMYSIIFDVLYILYIYIRFLFESFFEFKLL